MRYILSVIAIAALFGTGIILNQYRYEEQEIVMEEETFPGCDMNVLVYMSPYCKYCTYAKELLDDMNIPYTAVDVSNSHVKRKELADKTGRSTIPQIYIDEFHVGGFDDLKALKDSGKLKKFLQTCDPSTLK